MRKRFSSSVDEFDQEQVYKKFDAMYEILESQDLSAVAKMHKSGRMRVVNRVKSLDDKSYKKRLD